MYASSEKKIDILNDHYKDTFSHLVSYRKQRDRLLLYLLGVAMILLLYQFFPDETPEIIFDIAGKKLGVDIDLSFIDRIFLVFVPVYVFYFVAGRRYWQIWNLIDDQYDYLEKLEKELASLYASGVPFTRETKYSNRGHNLSIWNNEYYNYVFRAIFTFILPLLGATFAVRQYGFKMPHSAISAIFLIAFLSPWILRKLREIFSKKTGRVWGFIAGILITAVVATILFESFFSTLFFELF